MYYGNVCPNLIKTCTFGVSQERKVGVKIGLYEGLIDGLMFVTQNALSECYTVSI